LCKGKLLRFKIVNTIIIIKNININIIVLLITLLFQFIMKLCI